MPLRRGTGLGIEMLQVQTPAELYFLSLTPQTHLPLIPHHTMEAFIIASAIA